MKIKVVTGGSLYLSSKNLIKQIDVGDLTSKHYVLVPDRFSLQVENLIMDLCDLESTFNIEVLGLSRLANKVLKELGIKGETLSSDECLLLTQQAIENVKHEFVSFKKSSINFAQEVSKVIAQFKSSRLAPQDITSKNCSQTIKNKYHDLALIYREYETLIEGKFDANKLLTLFSNLVLESEILKNINLYLVGFDSFTSEMFDIITTLAKSASSVFIALPKATTLGNAFIYEDDILHKLTDVCNEEGITIEVQECKDELNKNQIAICENLYSENLKQAGADDFFHPIACQSLLQEVMTVGKLINAYVRRGGHYNEVVIACSNLDKYKPYLDRCFDELEIPFFADKSQTADKLVLSNSIINFLKVVATGFAKEALLDYFSMPIIKNDNQNLILQKIILNNVHGKNKAFKYLLSLAENEFAGFENLCSCKTCHDCVKVISVFIESHKKCYECLLDSIKSDYLFEYNLNLQTEDYILKALESINKYQGQYEISVNEFIKKLQLLLSFNEVSTVPTYVDSVMVGDATSSYFVETKNLFVLGGGEGLPRVLQDNGLVSDNEIFSVNFIKALEPSIRMLNRRNRFKLFNLLLLAKDRLFVTYRSINDDGKKIETPGFVESLCKIFAAAPKRASNYFRSLNNENDENFVYGLGSKKSAIKELAGGGKSRFISNRQMTSLSKALNFDIAGLWLNRENVNCDLQKLYFPKDSTKVTQLECYFSCPFKHFVRYGLKLEAREDGEIKPRDIGNICHRMAQLFVMKNIDSLGELDDVAIQIFINQTFTKILEELSLENILEEEDGIAIINFIKHQCNIILTRIVYEQKYSAFKPIALEKQLEGISIPIEGKNKSLKLQGKVDRIDRFDNFFRIIDYKTGKVDPILKDLAYGDKLQLFIYQKAIGEMLEIVPSGVFYFDCKFDFKEDEGEVLLKGLVINDDKVISNSDKRLGVQEKSDLISVATRKAVKNNSSFKGAAICKTNLFNLAEYASRLASKALGEIFDGFILPKPDDFSCEHCDYRGICLYDAKHGVRTKGRVAEESIEKIVKGAKDE